MHDEKICIYCLDSKGVPKYAYKDEKTAKQIARNSTKKLSVYWCPFGEGWHLTSR